MPSNKHELKPEEWDELENILKAMVADKKYITDSSYSSNIQSYPDHLIPFVDKHMDYLRKHPTIDPYHYLSNLKLMTKNS